MSTFVPVSFERHGTMRLRRSDYAFAAGHAVVPLAGVELAAAALTLPVAFVRAAEAFTPAAVLGLETDRNVFVEYGKWRGAYVPAALRAYPFALARIDDGRQVLCVDEASGLVDAGSHGARLFDDDGQPAQFVRELMSFLEGIERNRVATATACAALEAADVIEPWPIALKYDDGERKVEGLFRVSESALGALSPEAFLSLRTSGALPLAYAQLLSMPHLRVVAERVAAQNRAAAVRLGEDLDLSMFEGGTLKFDVNLH